MALFQPRPAPTPPPPADSQASDVSSPTELDRALVSFRESLDPLHAYTAQMEASIAVIKQAMQRIDAAYQAPILEIAQLNSNPYPLRLHGRHHNMIFLPATAVISATIPGLGVVNLSLAPGWNALDLPEGTLLTAGTAISVLYRASNARVGDAI